MEMIATPPIYSCFFPDVVSEYRLVNLSLKQLLVLNFGDMFKTFVVFEFRINFRLYFSFIYFFSIHETNETEIPSHLFAIP